MLSRSRVARRPLPRVAVMFGMVAGLRATLLRNAWSTVEKCSASVLQCFWTSCHIFYVMVYSVPEVGSRPSLERRCLARGGNLNITSVSPLCLAVLRSLSGFCWRRVLFSALNGSQLWVIEGSGVAGSPGVLTPR